VRAEPISAAQMREVEPEARGVAAIQVSETAVLDFADVCRGLAHRLQQSGASIVLTARVSGIVQRSGSVVIETSAGAFEARAAVNCAGLQSDRIARSSGAQLEHRIVPFRGDYYELVGRARALVRGLIYPVPDVRFPFLGVHFTRRIDDRVECGPNAVLALGREAYEEGQLDVGDLLEALTYPGFLKLALRHARIGLGEALRSASKRSFVAALQRLVPAVQSTHLAPAGCGIRAQAIGRDGTPIDDFLIIEVGRVVNVCNAPSPAATASLAIGALIAERVGSLVIEAAIRRV
jgi:L-2-hydroxyglutarate oxidase LhgO